MFDFIEPRTALVASNAGSRIPLHRKPAPPRASSSRSTVSPLVRQGSLGTFASTSGSVSGPGCTHLAIERIDARKAKIMRQRADERSVPILTQCRGERGSRATSRSVSCRPAGACPRTCSPSRICASFKLTNIGVELLQRGIFVIVVGNAGIRVEAVRPDEIKNMLAQQREPLRDRGRAPDNTHRSGLRDP